MKRLAVISIAGLLLIGAAATVFAYARHRRDAWLSTARNHLVLIQQAALVYRAEFDDDALDRMDRLTGTPTPRGFEALLLQNYVSPNVLLVSNSRTLAAPPFTYTHGWCYIGDFAFTDRFWSPPSMAAAAPDFVLAVSAGCPYHRDARVVLLAQSGAVVVDGADWLASENALREAHGIPTLAFPDQW